MLGNFLDEKSSIKLCSIMKIDQSYLRTQRAFLISDCGINTFLFILAIKLTTRNEISGLGKFLIN